MKTEKGGDSFWIALLCVVIAGSILNCVVITPPDGLDLSGQELSHPDFSWKDLRGCRFVTTQIDRGLFVGADIHGVDLRSSYLNHADLRGANLLRANLSKADGSLRATQLVGADLRGADLRQADLRGANMLGAKLTAETSKLHPFRKRLRGRNKQIAVFSCQDCDLRGAIYDDETLWPSGFNPETAGAIEKGGQ